MFYIRCKEIKYKFIFTEETNIKIGFFKFIQYIKSQIFEKIYNDQFLNNYFFLLLNFLLKKFFILFIIKNQ